MRTQLLSLLLALGVVPAAPAQTPAPSDARASLYVTAAAAGEFTSFLAAVETAGLGPVLDRGEAYTLFIPTDRAMAALDREQRDRLFSPNHRNALFGVLSYHLVPGRHTIADLGGRTSIRSVSGQLLILSPAGATLTVDGADVVRADIDCFNGVIHVIDAVLVPNTRDLLTTLKAEGRFRTLLELVDEASLEDFVEQNAPLTFFAPTDEAFAKLDRYIVADLERSRNRAVLTELLKRHIVPGEHPVDSLIGSGPVSSLAGSPISVSRTPDALIASDPSGTSRANLVRTDLDGPGGVVHQIDTVLLPPDGLKIVPDGRLIVGVFTDSVSQSLAAQLNVRPRECLLITGLTRGGPSERAGLKANDVVVLVDDLPATSGNLDLLKSRKGFGGVIRFDIIRAGQRLTIPVTVGVERD